MVSYRAALSFAFCLVGGSAMAQSESATELACEVKNASEVIRIALCAEELDDATLAETGKAICDRTLPCGVWFYLDALAMPAQAPKSHDGLTQNEVTGSIGVWVHEQSSLIRIDEVAKE